MRVFPQGLVALGSTSSTRLMVITTTLAASLAAGSALRSVPEAQRPQALLLLALMAGAVLVAAGLAGLGRYTRFVSYSVMIGFLTRDLGQHRRAARSGRRPDRRRSQGRVPGGQGGRRDHPSRPALTWPRCWPGWRALAILVVLARTRIAMVSALIALVIPTVVVILAGADSVARVGDAGDIPRGHPGAAPARPRDLLLQPGHRRAGGRRDRSGPGPGSPRPHPTLTRAPSDIHTGTSSPRGPPTWPRGSSGA